MEPILNNYWSQWCLVWLPCSQSLTDKTTTSAAKWTSKYRFQLELAYSDSNLITVLQSSQFRWKSTRILFFLDQYSLTFTSMTHIKVEKKTEFTNSLVNLIQCLSHFSWYKSLSYRSSILQSISMLWLIADQNYWLTIKWFIEFITNSNKIIKFI